MKISYNWLRRYAAVDASPDELAETLTMGGLEVEGIDRVGSAMDGVLVGRVLSVRSHPNADRLTLCDVDLGNGPAVQIVCGAPNVKAGQKVPVATTGTTLMLPDRDDPDVRQPFTIKKAKIRGESSEGMICAENELGLSDDHSGIMVLAQDAEVGRPFRDYLADRGVETSDAVLDVSITPNRPDAASHIGVARDSAALTGARLSLPDVDLPPPGGETAGQVSVEIQAPDLCPRYVALLVRGVSVKESPTWLKRRLSSIGLRPRNHVVDVTNFVLHECGQPLHAFDFDDISGATIRVTKTGEERTFTTLDGKERMLPAGTLMIADAERDVAVAGVMGGQNSEVGRGTTNVLIESAYFDPSSIRRTARALGIQTDASYRFERGVDRDGQVWAAARAAALIAEIGGGAVVPGVVDAHPVPFERREVDLRTSRVEGLLGVHVPVETIKQLLTSIGFEVDERGTADESVLVCTVPTYRPDVEREVDVVEEIVRLYGYDKVPEPTRSVAPSRAPHELPDDRLRRTVRAFLRGSGCREIYTNSMLRAETARRFNQEALTGEVMAGDIVETLNPISQEMAALRASLLPGALQVMSFNRKHGRRVLRFFELGHVFHRSGRPDTVVDGYAEHESLIVAASGLAVEAGWDVSERTTDLFDLKGIVEALLETMRLPAVRMVPVYEPTPVTEHHLEVFAGDTWIGLVARLSAAIEDEYDLDEPVYFAELDFATMVGLAAPHLDTSYRAVSRHPVVERDIAVVVDRGREAGALMKTIRSAAGDLLRHVGIFDLYEGEHVGEGKKSVAFSLRFGADRTLTDEEVEERVAAVVSALEDEHGARLRS